MTSRKPEDLLIRIAVIAASLAMTAAAGLAFWQWRDPLHAPLIYPFSETYYQRSVAAKTPGDQIAWALQTTQVAPERANSWLLLATAYEAADGALSPRVLASLRKSYEVSALSPYASEWRLTYLYADWSHVPADLRQSALRETNTCLAARRSCYRSLKDALSRIQDPAGRLALGVTILAADKQARSAWLQAHPPHGV